MINRSPPIFIAVAEFMKRICLHTDKTSGKEYCVSEDITNVSFSEIYFHGYGYIRGPLGQERPFIG